MVNALLQWSYVRLLKKIGGFKELKVQVRQIHGFRATNCGGHATILSTVIKKAFVSVFLRLLLNGSRVSFRRGVWLMTDES